MPAISTFTVLPDIYGTNKIGYKTNIVLQFNMGNPLQYLFAKSTGSMISITCNTTIVAGTECLIYLDNDLYT
jgi:hypothetical protein